MPELPEVETVKRTLEEKIVGCKFTGLKVFMPKVVKAGEVDDVAGAIAGKRVVRMGRRGKYLLVYLENNLVLVVHLRMTGQLVHSAPDQELPKHTHVVFNLDNGQQLRFVDQRQFGRIYLVPANALDVLSGLRNMGLEPFDPDFTKEYFKKELRNRRTKIKPLLLDQSFVAGIGNIYADEALHRALVHPERPAYTLNPREAAKLYQAIKDVLEEGIANRGTSIKDYVDGEGRSGENQHQLRVYGREGQPCLKCKKPIHRIKVGGRSSYFCARCQKI
ncbi:MAG: bifunctional DNA-formamidopyrimidine glycosylase/DNA-(apurinic or apyrimidinic site) lyase [Bacillota bacterium]